MSYGWNEETDATLRELWGTGMSSMKIGRAMGRTKGSIIGRAHRLGLEKREQPASILRAKAPPVGNPKGALEVVRAQERATEALTALAAVNHPPEAPPPSPPILEPLRPIPFYVPPHTGHVHECQWPIGHPKRPGFHFCGARTVPDRPYCREHCEIAYIGYGRPRQEPLRVWIRGQRV
jgi:GcrA cell cycle regulator